MADNRFKMYDGPDMNRHVPATETEKNMTYVKYAAPSHTREKPFTLHDGEKKELSDWAKSETPSLRTLVPIIERIKRRAWGLGLDDAADIGKAPAGYISRQRENVFEAVLAMLKDEQKDILKNHGSPTEIDANDYMRGYWNALTDVASLVRMMKKEAEEV